MMKQRVVLWLGLPPPPVCPRAAWDVAMSNLEFLIPPASEPGSSGGTFLVKVKNHEGRCE